MMIIGYCGNCERMAVKWYQNECVRIEEANVTITVACMSYQEVIETCKRNLICFETC